MKKKANKLLASVTAAAMSVMCAFAAVPKVEVSAAAPIHTIEWNWSDDSLLDGIDDPTAVKKAVVNMQYAANTSEYANGKLTSNSNGTNGSDGWKEVTYGTGSQTFKLTAGTAADVEVEVAGVTDWIQIGVSEYGGGNLTINSVKLLDENGDALAAKSIGKSLGTPYSGSNDNLTGWDETKAATIKKISANVQYAGGTNGYANGKLTANSDGGWKEVTFGTGDQTFKLTAGTAADVELEVTGITNWLQFGVAEYGGGTLTVNSIKFLDENGAAVYELPASSSPTPPDEPDEPDTPDPTPDEPDDNITVAPPANTTDTTVAADNSAIKNAVTLTDAEKAQGVTLNLKVESTDLDTTETETISNAAANRGLTVSNIYLDIKLVKTTGGSESDVTALAKPLPITINIPAGLLNTDSTKERTYYVVHLHGGQAEILGGTFANGKFTFSVDGFSAFVLAYKDTPKAVEPSGSAVWEGTAAIPDWSANLQIPADNFSAVNGGDTVKITYLPDGDDAQMKIMSLAEGWPALNSTNPNEWGCAPISGSPYSFVISADDAAAVKANGMVISGQKLTITKIEVISGGSTPVDPVDPIPPTPETKPAYSVTVSGYAGYATVTGDRTAGSVMTVSMPIGFVARVYSGSTLIATIYDSGKFTMPAGSVYISVTDESGAGMMAYAAPNSYIFSYDSSMKLIKTTRSKKGIRGTGEMTVNLGAEYAGRTVTLYSGKNSTADKITEAELDSKGCATFTVEGAKNYTLVVEE